MLDLNVMEVIHVIGYPSFIGTIPKNPQFVEDIHQGN
jgi:hypothetical protein